MTFLTRTGLTLLLLCGVLIPGFVNPAAGEGAPLEVATFFTEITPPMGHPLCGGWIMPVIGVDSPQLAKGVILRQGDEVCVLCSMDWCEVCNATYDRYRKVIAEAAGTNPKRVALQSIHQHNALLVDSNIQRILDTVEGSPLHAEYDFLDETAGNLASAVAKAMTRFKSVTHIGTGKAKVEKVASSRRLLQPDGRMVVRYSSAKQQELRDMPEGKIDPWLRTVSLCDGDKPLVRMHYYATHPQSYYGDGRTNYEFPGMARERVEKESGVFQIYFTGCGGDVAAGKYNDGSHPVRAILADRMYEGMIASVSATTVEPLARNLGWKTVDLTFPQREDKGYREEDYRNQLENAEAGATARIKGARGLSWCKRVSDGVPTDISCLSLGDVRILHLPGEPMVEFQLEAQRIAEPDAFVAVAGYGNAGMGYICTEESYAEGGYEPTASLIAPKSEWVLKDGIAELLKE